MWTALFLRMMRQLIKRGALEITLPDGSVERFGRGHPVRIMMSDPSLPRRIVMSPELAVGEGYMEGTLTIENDDLYGFWRSVFAISLSDRAMGWNATSALG